MAWTRRCASCTAAYRRGEASRPARGRCGSAPPTPAIPGSSPSVVSPVPTPATAPVTTSPASTPPAPTPVTRTPPRSWAPRPTSTAGCGTAPNTRPSPPPGTPRSSPSSPRPSPRASTDRPTEPPAGAAASDPATRDHRNNTEGSPSSDISRLLAMITSVSSSFDRPKSVICRCGPACPASPGRDHACRGPNAGAAPAPRPVSFRWAVAASAGGLEDEQVAGADRYRVTAGHGDDGPVRPLDPVPPQRPGRAARHPVRRHPPVAGQGGHRHRLAEPDLAVAPVAAPPAARAPAAPPDRVPLQPHRVPPLQHLGIGEP